MTCRVAAPLLPLTTEAVWRGLTGHRSVHLVDYPDPAVGDVHNGVPVRVAIAVVSA